MLAGLKTRMVEVHQIATCLIVCNLLVIVTYLYRVLGYKNHDSISDLTDQDTAFEKDDLSTSPMSPHMTLTTIDHLFSMLSGASLSVASDEIVSKPVSVADSDC